MTDFILKKFIKNSENTDDPTVRSAMGKFSGKVGIFCNILLSGGKFFAGIISGSVSITADAVNNLSDASSSLISLLGFKLSEKKADNEHPYGHGRYEYLAGFAVAALIIAIGFQLLRESIDKIIHPTEVEFGVLSVVILAVSILVKLWLMMFYTKIGKRINSETLFASAADSRNDVISTSAVLVALIISRFCNSQLDGIMGVAVAIFILYSVVGLVRDAMDPLLGKAPSSELVEKIRKKILSYKGVVGTHDLMIHDYGPGRQFASVHVEVPAEMSLVECHDIIDTIEQDFLDEGLNMLVHPDPIFTETDGNTTAQINGELKEIVKKIDPRITIHDVRAVPCPEFIKVIFDCVLPTDCSIDEKDLQEEITRFLCLKFSDCRCVISFEHSFASIPK